MLLDAMQQNLETTVPTWLAADDSLAKKYGVKLVAYESGFSQYTDYLSSSAQAPMTALIAAANREPRMQQIYAQYLNLWAANGGSVINQFEDIDTWGVFGFWGSLEYVGEPADSAPKYQALVDFAAQHPGNAQSGQ
jgi:hypothetical protein